jgi:hypothetical protein
LPFLAIWREVEIKVRKPEFMIFKRENGKVRKVRIEETELLRNEYLLTR